MELDAALNIIDSCISQIKWRLKPSPRRRLHTDILALCTGMRPVVMVDYGGKLPELQERLCSVLQLSQKESSILRILRVMVIDDMIYLINVKELAEYVKASLNADIKLHFVDLEQDPPKMIAQSEPNSNAKELVSVQRFFSTVFPVDGTDKELFPPPTGDHVVNNKSIAGEISTSQSSSDVIDLSCCMQDCQVTIPTLNGWLLGYPVVYLFGRDHISDSIYNLSTKSLQLFQISIHRSGGTSTSGPRQEELMSFSVPRSLSMERENEAWAEAFLARLLAKLETCKHVWASLKMEVSQCYPQAIVL
ncbi:hypothetical protein C5167_030326 [Papaver somniferum]|uniref:uncharacterized protein LOC113330178 n=1 Tax=Papaver somniferum TaxID=3469 RepID=UPI000E7009E0|nr:uncharacterized protein LOC113330178 [Papaver somniferum]RZC86975.1 hypothetical protein C5167_030326 [Papaver somniferum]